MKNGNAFFQDDYKVSQRLTLNMGMRWEYDGNLSDKYGNAVNLWPSAMQAVPVPATTQYRLLRAFRCFQPEARTRDGWCLRTITGPCSRASSPAGTRSPRKNGIPKDDFSPRLGFAYQPTKGNRLVLRGGFGFFYDRVDGNLLVHSIEQSPPYAPTLDQPAQTNRSRRWPRRSSSTHSDSFPNVG